MRLRGLFCGAEYGFGFGPLHVVVKGFSEDGKVAVGLEATEGLLRFDEPHGGPSEGHLGVAPALDVAADRSHRAERVFDGVGAGQRSPEFAG